MTAEDSRLLRERRAERRHRDIGGLPDGEQQDRRRFPPHVGRKGLDGRDDHRIWRRRHGRLRHCQVGAGDNRMSAEPKSVAVATYVMAGGRAGRISTDSPTVDRVVPRTQECAQFQ